MKEQRGVTPGWAAELRYLMRKSPARQPLPWLVVDLFFKLTSLSNWAMALAHEDFQECT
jgi:hypothetical protein